MMRDFWFWLTHNASSAHHRFMARYLKRRGWVVFYLEKQDRECFHPTPGGCWLSLYNEQESYVKPGHYLHRPMPPKSAV